MAARKRKKRKPNPKKPKRAQPAELNPEVEAAPVADLEEREDEGGFNAGWIVAVVAIVLIGIAYWLNQSGDGDGGELRELDGHEGETRAATRGGDGADPESDETPAPGDETVEELRVEVIRTFDHAPDAFTQGLLFYDGFLYESTGQRGSSTLRKVSLEDGAVIRRVQMDEDVFAEGLARVDDRLIQLTWTAGEATEYALDFEPLRSFQYEGEGWGLCYDGERLVMSDGSARLTFRDPEDFRVIGGVEVTHDGAPVARLNELECVGAAVWANVWQTDRIVRIDPQSGRVTATVDASGPARRPRAVGRRCAQRDRVGRAARSLRDHGQALAPRVRGRLRARARR